VLGVVSSENIAEVSSGNGELDLGVDDVVGELTLDVEEGREVVDGLGEDASPVDRVDGTEAVLGVEGRVGEEGLDDVLWGYKRVSS